MENANFILNTIEMDHYADLNSCRLNTILESHAILIMKNILTNDSMF